MVLTATAATTAAIGLAFAVVFGGGIIKQADARDGACEVGSNMSSCASRGVGSCEMDSNGTCEIEAKGRTAKIDITCDALKGNQIDWDCVFGPESLEEVFDRGGKMTTCKEGTKSEPCSRFIVPKEEERAEVKVQAGPEGFPFLKHEKYIFRYSFQAKEGMRVAKRFTHLGQLKGSKNRRMLKGDPIYSLTANHHGLNVRFSNKESIEDFHDGMEKHLDWDKATGEWVHVKVTTVFGESMEVELSGAVSGKAVWPKHLEPVAWHRDSEMVRMKLGLYHSKGNVHDQEVIYKNVSIEGPNGIIRSGDKANSELSDKDCVKKNDKKKKDNEIAEGTSEIEATGRVAKIDITCDPLKGNQIDWDCVFGPESLEEVFDRGGEMTTCEEGTKSEPCSRFIVPKEEERAEVKVQAGPEGFPFLKHEKYIFRYSFQAKEGMRVAKRFTHLGQLKGSKNRRMLKGDPIFSLTANQHGLNVRFSNKESIEDFHDGMEKHLDWDKATGEWVHVKVTTVFGESMEVELSGAVSGKAVWPKHLEPVAWHRDSEMVRMKLGLYHSKGNVHDQEVIYKNVSIEGPNGIIRSGDKANSEPSDKDCAKKDDKKQDDKKTKDNEIAEVKGYTYKGCFRDTKEDRVFPSESKSDSMTTEKCAEYCKGSKVFATQHARECWCGDSKTDFDKHGKADCNLVCSGSKNGEICGGKWAMSVYQADGKTKSDDKDSAPDGTKCLGCFKDDKVHRALDLVDKNVSDNMTLEKCHKFCSKQRGATHMGLEFSTECFCGGSKGDHDVYGGAKCDMPCAGDSGSVCGGRLALSVYKI